MSIYIVMHHAHTAQRGRGNEKRLDLRTRVEKLKYLPIYTYIYTRLYMKVHKFATRHSQPERDTDCGKLFAK